MQALGIPPIVFKPKMVTMVGVIQAIDNRLGASRRFNRYVLSGHAVETVEVPIDVDDDNADEAALDDGQLEAAAAEAGQCQRRAG